MDIPRDEIAALIKQHGTITAAARALGMPRERLRDQYHRAGLTKDQTASNQTTPADSVEMQGDTSVVTKTTHESVRTLADLVRVCEIDLDEWTVERWVANKWEMGSKDAKGEPQTTPLFQIKAWLKRRIVAMAVRNEIADLKAEAKRHIKIASAPPVTVPKDADTILELAIPDLHVGKLAWAKETGYDNYDVKIAEQLFEEALTALLARTAGHTFARIVFVCGNDLLHTDNEANTTHAGTQMHADGRYHKTFIVVRRMITRAVERLRRIAPVVVIVVPGNHDTLSAWHLGDSLECRFHDQPDVTIDNEPRTRKYHQFGAVMLMFTHGERGKQPNYPLLMATEQPQMWAESLYREAHTGHLHQTRTSEYNGVRVRISPALCAPDAWHAEHQMVGNQRSAEAFVWHRNEGLIGTAHFTVPQKTDNAA